MAATCASATFCVEVRDGRARTFDGKAWSSATTVRSLDGREPLSCPTSRWCAAIAANTVTIGSAP